MIYIFFKKVASRLLFDIILFEMGQMGTGKMKYVWAMLTFLKDKLNILKYYIFSIPRTVDINWVWKSEMFCEKN